jgi:hypothetical protein
MNGSRHIAKSEKAIPKKLQFRSVDPLHARQRNTIHISHSTREYALHNARNASTLRVTGGQFRQPQQRCAEPITSAAHGIKGREPRATPSFHPRSLEEA